MPRSILEIPDPTLSPLEFLPFLAIHAVSVQQHLVFLVQCTLLEIPRIPVHF
jgi:hypothetical protein